MIRAVLALAHLVAAGTAQSQDIEPRKWSDTPVGVNFLILGYAYTQGGMAPDIRRTRSLRPRSRVELST
jgi:hypothetical protein